MSRDISPGNAAHQPSASQVSSTNEHITISLKRRASPSFTCEEEGSRKKMKEESKDNDQLTVIRASERENAIIEELAEELQCGCCAALLYQPVLLMPCQHFFCGSCCVLWVKCGGSNCPSCRREATSVAPFRAIQSVIDTFLRNAPHKARSEKEREQADHYYKVDQPIRIPPPIEGSPPPDVNRSVDFVLPCPHCFIGNPHGWSCPQPIADPTTDMEHAWPIDDGLPPGHGHCGHCESILALQAPDTTKCDLCLALFCGVGIQSRCSAKPVKSQLPHGLSTLPELIESESVYDCFDGNVVEVDEMLDYLGNHKLTPRHIYNDIVEHIQKQPRSFSMLSSLDLFNVIEASGSLPQISRDPKACGLCAAEIFLWGIKDWWVRERQKDQSAVNLKDCPEIGSCTRQKDDPGHAREFNHTPPTSAATPSAEALAVNGDAEPNSAAPHVSSTPPAPITTESTTNA